MYKKFEQNVAVDIAVSPRTVTTTTEIDGTGVDMAKFDGCCFAIQLKSGTQSGALTCYIAESTDNSTWSDTMLATVTVASSTDTDAIDTVEVRAEQMTAGYRYLRLEVNPASGASKTLSAIAMRFNPRFATGSAL